MNTMALFNEMLRPIQPLITPQILVFQVKNYVCHDIFISGYLRVPALLHS